MRISLLISAIFFASILFIVFYFGPESPSQKDIAQHTATTTSPEEKLSGTIYYLDDYQETKKTAIFSYDLSEGTHTVYQDDPELYFGPFTVVSQDAAILTTAPYVPDALFDFPYIDYLDFSFQDTSFDNIPLPDISIIRDIQYAPDHAHFAFSGLSQEAVLREKQGKPVDYGDIMNYSVYLIGSDGIEMELTEGIAPLWIQGSNKLYFLKEDGMYAFDIVTKNIDVVFSNSTYRISRWARLAATHDGAYIALAAPKVRDVYLYRIRQIEPLRLEPVKTLRFDESGPVYDVFPLGESLIGYVLYDSSRTASIYALNPLTFIASKVFTVKVNSPLSIEPVWVP